MTYYRCSDQDFGADHWKQYWSLTSKKKPDISLARDFLKALYCFIIFNVMLIMMVVSFNAVHFKRNSQNAQII